MFIYSSVRQAIQYLIAIFFEIFGSSHDDYPVIGIQPFTGTIPYRNKKA